MNDQTGIIARDIEGVYKESERGATVAVSEKVPWKRRVVPSGWVSRAKIEVYHLCIIIFNPN